jgi:hypothetical protein
VWELRGEGEGQSKSLVASLAAVSAFALVAGPAAAKPRKAVQPLGQYVVSGKVDTDELARAGFDLQEASVAGRKGRFSIVATPSKAAAIARKGATVRPVRGAGGPAPEPEPRRSPRPPRFPRRRTATTSSVLGA